MSENESENELMRVGASMLGRTRPGMMIVDNGRERPVTNIEMAAWSYYQSQGFGPRADRWVAAFLEWVAEGCPLYSEGKRDDKQRTSNRPR